MQIDGAELPDTANDRDMWFVTRRPDDHRPQMYTWSSDHQTWLPISNLNPIIPGLSIADLATPNPAGIITTTRTDFNVQFQPTLDRYRHEDVAGWRAATINIPAFELPPGFKIQVIPPFGAAAASFVIFKGDNQVSVYLDTTDSLGSVGQPYWEAYPIGVDGNVRYMNNETEFNEMIADIINTLNEYPVKDKDDGSRIIPPTELEL